MQGALKESSSSPHGAFFKRKIEEEQFEIRLNDEDDAIQLLLGALYSGKTIE